MNLRKRTKRIIIHISPSAANSHIFLFCFFFLPRGRSEPADLTPKSKTASFSRKKYPDFPTELQQRRLFRSYQKRREVLSRGSTVANQFLTLDYRGHRVTQGPGTLIENARVELRDRSRKKKKMTEDLYFTLFFFFY